MSLSLTGLRIMASALLSKSGKVPYVVNSVKSRSGENRHFSFPYCCGSRKYLLQYVSEKDNSRDMGVSFFFVVAWNCEKNSKCLNFRNFG